jgi:hypothetical protein
VIQRVHRAVILKGKGSAVQNLAVDRYQYFLKSITTPAIVRSGCGEDRTIRDRDEADS